MPKINKAFHLEITVEQFLQNCSPVELQELDLRLPVYLDRVAMKANEPRFTQAYEAGEKLAKVIAVPSSYCICTTDCLGAYHKGVSCKKILGHNK